MNPDYDFYRKAIEKSLLIVNKKAQTVPFTLNDPQNKILQSLGGRDIILKARQEGISSLILALFTIDFISIENVRCVVIAHESGATQKLFDRVKFYLDSLAKTFPGAAPYTLKYNNRRELVNVEKNSTFYIGTAGQRAFGRGDFINNLHISELAFWPNQEKTMIGLMAAVPKEGRIIIETTANGMGDYFYNMWKKAQHPSSPFKPHFLPWFDLEEYRLPVYQGFTPTPDEQELAKRFSLSHEQLNWRRFKIAEYGGDPFNEPPDSFLQEFPATAIEAFIVSGNPIWPTSLLKWYEKQCQPAKRVGNLLGGYQVFFEDNDKGDLKVWQEPLDHHDYVIGADVSEGIEVNPDAPERSKRRDYSVAIVFDRQTCEIVAVWHGHIEGDQFGRQLYLLGTWYNDALIGVERNNQGLVPLVTLRDMNYPRLYYMEKEGLASIESTNYLGWQTNRATRPLLVDEIGKWLRDKTIRIYDEEVIAEMVSFIRGSDGIGRAAPGAFDDRVMALGIALQMYERTPNSDRGNEIAQPDTPGNMSMFGGDDLLMDSPDGMEG